MFKIKFKGVPWNISSFNRDSTLGSLKSIIYEQTSVAPENQKLIGLKPSQGFILSDELTFNNILLPSISKVMLIGSTDEQIKSVTTKKFNDLDKINDDQECDELETDICQRSEYVAKIERRIKEYNIWLIENPRHDAKLLILDIDYTIFDHRSTAENVRDLMRPFLHEFLEKIYPYYDIGIWSATGLPWIKTKLYEMVLIFKSTNQLLSNLVGREQLQNLVENNLNSESTINTDNKCQVKTELETVDSLINNSTLTPKSMSSFEASPSGASVDGKRSNSNTICNSLTKIFEIFQKYLQLLHK